MINVPMEVPELKLRLFEYSMTSGISNIRIFEYFSGALVRSTLYQKLYILSLEAFQLI